MIEKWERVVDSGGVFSPLMTESSKRFACILHDLIIAKLETLVFKQMRWNLFMIIYQIGYKKWKLMKHLVLGKTSQ